MQLDELKQAAKRLRTLPSELVTQFSNLTHAQALDIVAQLHGYRHYHEAKQRLADTKTPEVNPTIDQLAQAIRKSREILMEPGGLIPVTGSLDAVGAIKWPESGSMLVHGPSGSGKTILAREIICMALARETPVRVFDTEGTYRHFTYALGGAHFYEADSPEALAAWNSNLPLVVVDVSGSAVVGLTAERFGGLPKNSLFVCEDLLRQALAFQPLGVRTLRILSAHLSEPPLASADVVVTAKKGSRTVWHVRCAGVSEVVELKHVLSMLRNETFF